MVSPCRPSQLLAQSNDETTNSDVTDELGKHVAMVQNLVKERGWHAMCRHFTGDTDIPATVANLPHPGARLLNRIRRTGVPVVIRTSPPNRRTLDERLARGAHRSAHEFDEFLREEFLDFISPAAYDTYAPTTPTRKLPCTPTTTTNMCPVRSRTATSRISSEFMPPHNTLKPIFRSGVSARRAPRPCLTAKPVRR